MARSAGWYSRNSNRSYPLAGTATATDDSGSPLPESLIADLKMRFPGGGGDRAYLSRVEVGNTNVAVLISVAAEIVAAVSVPIDEANEQQILPLTPLVPGVTGHVVFGEVRQPVDLSFSSAAQSGLCVQAATPQAGLNSAARFSRFGFDQLTGDRIQLLGDGDIDVTRELIELNDGIRNAYVIGLRPQTGRNPLTEYAGLCGRRPESGTCGDPQPVEAVNAVRPDCCGRIFIEFRGCAAMYPLEEACGVALACPLEVEDACPPKLGAISEDGELPGDSQTDDGADCEENEMDPKADQDLDDPRSSPEFWRTT